MHFWNVVQTIFHMADRLTYVYKQFYRGMFAFV